MTRKEKADARIEHARTVYTTASQAVRDSVQNFNAGLDNGVDLTLALANTYNAVKDEISFSNYMTACLYVVGLRLRTLSQRMENGDGKD